MDLYQLLKQSFPNHIQSTEVDNCLAQVISPNTNADGMGGLLVMVKHDEQAERNSNDSKQNSQQAGHQIDSDEIKADEVLWLRNFHAQSAYPLADREELLAVIDGVIHDELFWVMEYQLDEQGEIEQWHGVHLLDKHDELAVEPNIAYQILSWSGAFDRLVVG